MGAGGAGGFQFLYSSVSEPPCNDRIFHACHRLYHVPFIPCCRWRVSTSGCCVLHHCVFTFPHIPPPHLVFTRVSCRCVRVTVTVSSRRSLRFLQVFSSVPKHNFLCCRHRCRSCFHIVFSPCASPQLPHPSSASLTTCVLSVQGQVTVGATILTALFAAVSKQEHRG